MLKIDEYLPVYDFSEKHEQRIKCKPQEAYKGLQELDFSKSFIISLLFRLRGLKLHTFQRFLKIFTVLYNDPGREIVLGMIAKPWKLQGGLLHFAKEDFLNFNEADYAKIVWNFTFQQISDNQTLVSTETRILCTDQESRKRFKTYWFFIRPFSQLVRYDILRMLKKSLEA